MRALQRAWAALFPRRPATFVSSLSRAQAAARLRAAVKPTAFHALFRTAIVGPVSEDRVHLRRRRALVHNSVAPAFTGRFTVRDGRTTLQGVFAAPRFSQLVFGIGLLLIMFGWLQVVARVVAGPTTGDDVSFVWILPAVVVAGLLTTRVAWWLGRGDIAIIEATIERALAPDQADRRT